MQKSSHLIKTTLLWVTTLSRRANIPRFKERKSLLEVHQSGPQLGSRRLLRRLRASIANLDEATQMRWKWSQTKTETLPCITRGRFSQTWQDTRRALLSAHPLLITHPKTCKFLPPIKRALVSTLSGICSRKHLRYSLQSLLMCTGPSARACSFTSQYRQQIPFLSSFSSSWSLWLACSKSSTQISNVSVQTIKSTTVSSRRWLRWRTWSRRTMNSSHRSKRKTGNGNSITRLSKKSRAWISK